VIVVPMSVRSGDAAVRDALLSLGWEGDLASLTSSGIQSAAFQVRGIDPATIEAMVPIAARLGIEVVTGPDWMILMGARSRLGAFARPWLQPEAVRDLAMAIGMAMPAEMPTEWCHAAGSIALDGPVIVGVINATPDSFSESSRAGDLDEVLRRAGELIAGGATVLDIGGESTRPGSEPITVDEEISRVIPAIESVVRDHPDVPVSVDTVNATTARAAVAAGAVIINDVTAGRHDPALLAVAAETGAGLILSHSRGALGSLTDSVLANLGVDPLSEVVQDLDAARRTATAAGVQHRNIVLDPGFGFGKDASQNWRILAGLDAIVALGSPVLIGVSRKRFIGDATGRPVEDRDRGTAAACAIGYDRGARLFRVHDAESVRDALEVARAVTR
jgi:dihydropteroate synthase